MTARDNRSRANFQRYSQGPGRTQWVIDAMDADLKRWQARMAPLMSAAVISTALFFAIATIWKFGDIETRLMKSSSEFSDAAASTLVAPRDFNEQMRLEDTRAAYNLERELVARRYE